MPFTIRSLRLPFVKISKAPKTGRTFTWSAGPWQYNSRTGQHSLKLPGTVTYKSRTRPQKAAEAKKRAARRATQRAGWDAHFNQNAPAPAPAGKASGRAGTSSASGKKAARKAPAARGAAARPRSASTTHQAPAGSGAAAPYSASVTGGAGVGVSFADYMDTQLCRKPTARGGICQNMASKCPPGAHADGAAPASLSRTRAARLQRWEQETQDARAALRAKGYAIPGEETRAPDGARLTLSQRQERARAAGLCGARTRDGSPCLNTGQCPHHGGQ